MHGPNAPEVDSSRVSIVHRKGYGADKDHTKTVKRCKDAASLKISLTSHASSDRCQSLLNNVF